MRDRYRLKLSVGGGLRSEKRGKPAAAADGASVPCKGEEGDDKARLLLRPPIPIFFQLSVLSLQFNSNHGHSGANLLLFEKNSCQPVKCTKTDLSSSTYSPCHNSLTVFDLHTKSLESQLPEDKKFSCVYLLFLGSHVKSFAKGKTKCRRGKVLPLVHPPACKIDDRYSGSPGDLLAGHTSFLSLARPSLCCK